jgi:hypothetical protein
MNGRDKRRVGFPVIDVLICVFGAMSISEIQPTACLLFWSLDFGFMEPLVGAGGAGQSELMFSG